MDVNKKARAKLRYTRDYYERESNEVKLFIREEQGVRLAFGVPLGWKTYYSFIGMTWGFTFMAFQIAISEPIDSFGC